MEARVEKKNEKAKKKKIFSKSTITIDPYIASASKNMIKGLID